MTTTELPPGMRWHMRRGMKELDIVLNRWADTHYANASPEQREAFEALLKREDPDIWSWLMGFKPAPEAQTHALIEQLRAIR